MFQDFAIFCRKLCVLSLVGLGYGAGGCLERQVVKQPFANGEKIHDCGMSKTEFSLSGRR